MTFTITAFYASLLALGYVYLSFLVIGVRRRELISLGDGANHELEKNIRAHANFIEYVPLILILMLCLESMTQWQWMLHIGGIGVMLGRVLHAWGLRHHEGASWQRLVGMVLTFATIVFLAAANLWVIHYVV